MELETILVGVDGSRQSIHAASLACRIAEAVNGACYLLHAAPPLQTPADFLGMAAGEPPPRQHIKHESGRKIRSKLRKVVSPAVLERLEVVVGRAPKILAETARQRKADLVVVGAKRRAALARAFTGSVVPYLLRTLDVPVLLAAPLDGIPERILVAADLSDATERTLCYAAQLGRTLKARVRAIHVVEPQVLPAGLPLTLEVEQYHEYSRHAFEERLKGLNAPAGEFEHVVRQGDAAEEIAAEAADWAADLIVVGSHGRGLVDRLLLGSTTMRLANLLPASILVVPVAVAG